jgi:2-C-methyl-D-erythritol 2,4-cyclodiphosphate synthase
MKLRIGHGYDVHRFTTGDSVIVGGVKIPHDKSLEAHSDGDVALHSITDAVLGALGLGDIGTHFPDTDAQWSGADSVELLSAVWLPEYDRGWRIVNVDVTIIAERPKMGPHIATMRERIAVTLKTSSQQVNVKATTTEKLGYIGREEGIAVHAVVLLDNIL